MSNPNLIVPLNPEQTDQSIPVKNEPLSSEEKSSDQCILCWGWFSQILVWISVIILIAGFFIEDALSTCGAIFGIA